MGRQAILRNFAISSQGTVKLREDSLTLTALLPSSLAVISTTDKLQPAVNLELGLGLAESRPDWPPQDITGRDQEMGVKKT